MAAQLATAGFSWALAGSVLWSVALPAAGGYSLIRTLLVEPLVASAWYRERAPRWLRGIVDLVLWIFAPPAPAARAEAAGDAAVAQDPPAGAGKIAGEPERF
jgi:hypothetical protein